MSILDSDDDVERRKYIILLFSTIKKQITIILSRCSKSGHVLLNSRHILVTVILDIFILGIVTNRKYRLIVSKNESY